VNAFLRDPVAVTRLYHTDSLFRARVDSAAKDQATRAMREAWASRLGITATDTDSIIQAVAKRLGAGSRARPVRATAKRRRAPRLDTIALQDRIAKALEAGSVRGEELRKRVGLPAKALWKHAVDALLATKRIKKTGERRSTEYGLKN
jgi:hypothetical protein